MGITMEMYAAEQEEFVSIQQRVTSELTSAEEVHHLFNQLEGYPQANFSLHLHWPEDIDALCQALIAEGFSVPSCATNLLVEELWFDGVSAFVHRVSQDLPLALAQSTEGIIKNIAERWVKSYILDPSTDTAYYTTAYDAAVKALSDLRQISQDALARSKPLYFSLQWERFSGLLHCMEHTLAEQGKAALPIHRPFDELELCDVAFNHSMVDWPSQTSLYRVLVLFYPVSKGLEFWQLALRCPGQPGL